MRHSGHSDKVNIRCRAKLYGTYYAYMHMLHIHMGHILHIPDMHIFCISGNSFLGSPPWDLPQAQTRLVLTLKMEEAWDTGCGPPG